MIAPRLLVATNNAHKVTELRRLLGNAPYELVTPADLGLVIEVVEDGGTFRENAAKKAHAFSEASGLLALADDSGIEVDALGGRPGVHSARYGGPGLTDDQRVRVLLHELADVSDPERACRYRVVLALADLDGSEQFAEAACEGMVAREPLGTNGFGYDPVFYIPAYGRTIAQLEPPQKDAISHRGQAARAMAELLAGRAESTP